MTNDKRLVLGTAMWGWTISKEVAFELLDHFYKAGFRQIDAATNYPINKVPADFRRSEQILLEWIEAHQVQDLEIMMKVGSISNMRTPDHNLKGSFLLLNAQQYQARFGVNLDTLMIHWDNRSEVAEIEESIIALEKIHQTGLHIGFSGVKHPAIHAALLHGKEIPLKIQIKHNLLYSDYPRYQDFHDRAKFYTYGINAGGMKMKTAQYHEKSSLKVRGGNTKQSHSAVADLEALYENWNNQKAEPVLNKMNEAAMIFAYHSEGVEGILIGPSRISQAQDSIQFFKQLQAYDFSPFYEMLLKLHRKYAPTDRKI